MVQLMERPRIGRYILTKDLEPGALGPRFLALHEADSSSHVLHRPQAARDRLDPRRFLTLMTAARALSHPHIIEIEQFGLDSRGSPYIVTPFTGDASGIVSLQTLLKARSGFLSPTESRQAAVQVLEAVDDAHRRAQCHGPLDMSEVLVDRRGSIVIELYGVRRLLGMLDDASDDLEREEVRSAIRIGYRLVTGLVPEEPFITASRVVPGLDRAWDDWFETGLLSGPGFKSAAHALSAIRDRSALELAHTGAGRVRSAISRFLLTGR